MAKQKNAVKEGKVRGVGNRAREFSWDAGGGSSKEGTFSVQVSHGRKKKNLGGSAAFLIEELWSDRGRVTGALGFLSSACDTAVGPLDHALVALCRGITEQKD